MGSEGAGRILVVDADPEWRALVASLLQRVGFATEEAETGEAALDAADRERPILVVLEVHLPGSTGYEICRELRDEFGERLPIMLMSADRTEPADRVAGLLIGADDYLVKPFEPDELLGRVRRLVARAAPLERGVAWKLTARELQVLSLLVDGLQQPEIAQRLFISPKTVAKHIEHVLAKLGVHSRTQAVALAVRDHVLEQLGDELAVDQSLGTRRAGRHEPKPMTAKQRAS